MTREEFCKRYTLSENQFFGRFPISRDLHIKGIDHLPEGFSPDVSFGLTIDDIKNLPEGFSPRVGINLDIRINKLPKGFAPIVTGNLFLRLTPVSELTDDMNLSKVDGNIFFEDVTNWSWRCFIDGISSGKYFGLLNKRDMFI
jgi:hypothetical protein